MPRPSSSKKSPVARAIVDLRAKLGDSQPTFASRLRLAHQTVARWETKVPPTGVMLKMLWHLADEISLPRVGDVFREAYLKELEERDGLRGRFALQGDIRTRLAKMVGALKPLLDPHRNKITPVDVEATLTSAEPLLDKTLPAELMIYQELLRALGSLKASVSPKESDKTGPLERLKLARKSLDELQVCLDSLYIEGPANSESEA